MVNSLGKVLERMQVVLIFFVASAIVLLLLNEDVKDRRVSVMADEFIMEATKDGCLTREEYLIFIDSVAKLDDSFEVELTRKTYITEPYYELAVESKLQDYFRGRNVRRSVYLPVETVEFEEPDVNTLVLQTETNASVLADLVGVTGYVPLPKDSEEAGVPVEGVVYEAVRPVQECYAGEKLVTVVKVEEAGNIYYMECDAEVAPSSSSDVMLKRLGMPIGVTINVVVFPRTYTCANMHTIALTRERIDLNKATSTYGTCPNCVVEPADIVPSVDTVTKVVGTPWSELGLTFVVVYKDGHSVPLAYNEDGFYWDYDRNYAGQQVVTVSYKGLVEECFNVKLTARECTVCGSLCMNRANSDYMRFSYCDACLVGSPFYFGETYVREEVVHNGGIVNVLDAEGVYYFNRGDYVKVELSRVRRGLPIPFLTERGISPVISGGFVRTKGR